MKLAVQGREACISEEEEGLGWSERSLDNQTGVGGMTRRMSCGRSHGKSFKKKIVLEQQSKLKIKID